MSELAVTKPFHVRRDRHGRKRLKVGEEATPEKIPRIARLMALAIRFDELIRSGVVADQAELARRGSVSRARMTQIMNLLHLSPQIQEELLFAGPLACYTAKEREIRKLPQETDWNAQRDQWRARTG